MIKEIDEKEHEMITMWGGDVQFRVLPQSLSPNFGLISYIKDKPIIAAWMYNMEGVYGFIVYPVANPEADNKERTPAFKELIESFEKRAKKEGLSFLFTTTNNGSLLKRFQDSKFLTTDTDVVHLIKKVG